MRQSDLGHWLTQNTDRPPERRARGKVATFRLSASGTGSLVYDGSVANQQTPQTDPTLGFTFLRDLDIADPAVRDAVLKGREILSRRAARNRDA